jgi:membrane protein implicated in regulation of membrane protease activity
MGLARIPRGDLKGVHMPWWGWLIAGVGLLGIEMFGIDLQFYLVFLGVSAVIVGLLGLAGLAMPEWLQWLLFAAFAVVTMVAFRGRVYALVRGNSGHVPERVTSGDKVVVPVHLDPGQTCRVDYRGTTWTARNTDVLPIAAGTEAVISRVDDLTLQLKRAAATN